MTPSHSFLLFICGILGTYAEFVRPGRIVAGLLGSAMALTGGYFLWKNAPTGVGLGLVGLAAILFGVEAFCRVDFITGIAGVAVLTCGFCALFAAGRRIPFSLAIPVSIGFGTLTMLLAYSAKRARQNKWADIASAK